MEDKVVFFEKYVSGIRYRGFYNRDKKEHEEIEIMTRVFEISEKIRQEYIEEGKVIL